MVQTIFLTLFLQDSHCNVAFMTMQIFITVPVFFDLSTILLPKKVVSRHPSKVPIDQKEHIRAQDVVIVQYTR